MEFAWKLNITARKNWRYQAIFYISIMNDNVVYIEGRNRMFDIILRYLYGFAKIHLRGIHINRFVNLCKARDIKLWDLEQKEDEIFFFTASKDIARLEEPARKTESDVEILRVYGIREFIRKNKKRIPFVAGFISVSYTHLTLPTN